MQTIETDKLAFAPVFTSAKGAKQLPILYANGDNVVWQPSEFLEIAFEPSSYNDPEANRVTMCVTPSDAVCATISAVDEWCIKTLSSNPVAFIGIQMTPEQIRERYVSCLKTSEKGYRTMRMKMNKSGRYALQCYTPRKGEKRSPRNLARMPSSASNMLKIDVYHGQGFRACARLHACIHARVWRG